MNYLATVDDKTYTIEINVEDEIFVDGLRLEVDLSGFPDQPVYSMILNGQSYEAFVSPTDRGLEVLMRGQLYMVSVEDEVQRRLRETSGAQVVQGGDYHLKAPMPGMVVAVPVSEGEEVVKGDDLVILESMKMQNELKAPRAGKVTRVRVRPGDRVEQNQVLVTMGSVKAANEGD